MTQESVGTLEELCEGGSCVIDLEALRNRAAAGPKDTANAVLVLLTRGTYGRYDDGFSAIQVANAALAREVPATMLLVGDGVYIACRDQTPQELGLRSNNFYLDDLFELDGRLLVLRSSLEKRGLGQGDLVDQAQLVDSSQLARELAAHRITLTF